MPASATGGHRIATNVEASGPRISTRRVHRQDALRRGVTRSCCRAPLHRPRPVLQGHPRATAAAWQLPDQGRHGPYRIEPGDTHAMWGATRAFLTAPGPRYRMAQGERAGCESRAPRVGRSRALGMPDCGSAKGGPVSTRTAFTRSSWPGTGVPTMRSSTSTRPTPSSAGTAGSCAPSGRRSASSPSIGRRAPRRDAAPPALRRGAERDLRRAALHPEGPRACHLARHVPDAQVHRAEPPGAAPVRLHARGRAPAARVHDIDPAAIRAHDRMADTSDCTRRLPGIIAESGLGALLGVGIFARDRSVARATSVFLEETRFAERQSVVNVLPRLPRAPGRPIPTRGHPARAGTWSARPSARRTAATPAPASASSATAAT